jgi:hypothetical protein
MSGIERAAQRKKEREGGSRYKGEEVGNVYIYIYVCMYVCVYANTLCKYTSMYKHIVCTYILGGPNQWGELASWVVKPILHC